MIEIPKIKIPRSPIRESAAAAAAQLGQQRQLQQHCSNSKHRHRRRKSHVTTERHQNYIIGASISINLSISGRYSKLIGWTKYSAASAWPSLVRFLRTLVSTARRLSNWSLIGRYCVGFRQISRFHPPLDVRRRIALSIRRSSIIECLGNVNSLIFVKIDNSRLFQNLKKSCESSWAGISRVKTEVKSRLEFRSQGLSLPRNIWCRQCYKTVKIWYQILTYDLFKFSNEWSVLMSRIDKCIECKFSRRLTGITIEIG